MATEISKVVGVIEGQNADFKTAINESIGLVDQFGRKLTASAKKVTTDNATLGRSFDALKRHIDPLYAAEKKLASSRKTILAASKAFSLSQEETNRLLGLAVTQYGMAEGAADNYNRALRANRFHTANVFAQIQDIGIMMAAGQNPLTTAIQQGGQLSQVFLAAGGGIRNTLKMLVGGFAGLVNPISLVTLATIAGASALGQWAFRARDSEEGAKTLADSVDELTDSTEAYNQLVQDQLPGNLDALADKYGSLTAEVWEFIEAQRTAAGIIADQKIAETIAMFGNFGKDEGWLSSIIPTTETISGNVENIAEKLQIAEDKARELHTTFYQLENSSTFDRQLELIVQLRNQLLAIIQEQGRATDEQAALLEQVKKTEEAMRLAAKATEQINAVWPSVHASIDLAAAKTASLESAFYAAAAAASTIRLPAAPGVTTSVLPDQEQYVGGYAASDLASGYGAMAAYYRRPAQPEKTGGGGGGGGKSLEEVFEQELETIMNGLATQEQVAQESYARQQEVLQQALDQRLITQQEFQEASQQSLAQYANAMYGIDKGYFGDSLQQAGAFFGDLANVFAQGNEKMMKISKIFAAAEALVNAWRAASQALADPSLPWFAKLGAAMSVLAAGMQMVTAIQGVTKSGGQKTLGGRSTSSTTSSAPAASRSPTQVAINLTGEVFSRSQVVGLINQINAAVDDGAVLRLS